MNGFTEDRHEAVAVRWLGQQYQGCAKKPQKELAQTREFFIQNIRLLKLYKMYYC